MRGLWPYQIRLNPADPCQLGAGRSAYPAVGPDVERAGGEHVQVPAATWSPRQPGQPTPTAKVPGSAGDKDRAVGQTSPRDET
jgi:hypothetical protein